VRLFPRTAVLPASTRPPRRSRVALGVGGVVLCCVAVSSAPWGVRADPLTDRKHDIERHIDRAHEDLDESSDRLRSATAAWLKARADLVEARAHLSRTRGELAVARALDRRMQQRLDAAVARLRDVFRMLADGRADVADQEVRLRQIVVSTFEQGDPDLMGLSMVLTTQDPAQLAGNLSAGSSVANAESSVLDRLEAENRVIMRYCDAEGRVTDAANPNGSARNIAGICNEGRNVFGLMPHPERAAESLLQSVDGRRLFESLAG